MNRCHEKWGKVQTCHGLPARLDKNWNTSAQREQHDDSDLRKGTYCIFPPAEDEMINLLMNRTLLLSNNYQTSQVWNWHRRHFTFKWSCLYFRSWANHLKLMPVPTNRGRLLKFCVGNTSPDSCHLLQVLSVYLVFLILSLSDYLSLV